MAVPDPSDTLPVVHRVKQEIDTLTEQQIEALRQATYVGMTPDEAQDFDARRKRIVLLVQELTQLEGAQ